MKKKKTWGAFTEVYYCPTSSCGLSERIFSTSASIVSDTCNRPLPINVEKLLFIRRTDRVLDEYHQSERKLFPLGTS